MSGDGGNAIVSANAISNYSYVNDSMHNRVQIARCVTGLGPNGTDNNTVLGGCYFNGSKIPLGMCTESSDIIVQPRAAVNLAGVINIQQCSEELTTDVEGVYTCIMLNSSVMNESIFFGVYFINRSEL